MFNPDDDEPEIKVPSEVIDNLRGILGGLPPQEHYLIQFDINTFSDFYNEFGPEQSAVVINGITQYLGRLEGNRDVDYGARVKQDQFVILSNNPHLGDILNEWISNHEFPLARSDLAPVGKLNPQHVRVHTGVMAFTPRPDLSLEQMLTRLADICQEAYENDPQIKYEAWQR
ncbi:diguanylate cyclase [Candidatus Woesearchaeota archaeon]|nr:diguanylate cyclase [Candidatus Woesearchaeota archaeon]